MTRVALYARFSTDMQREASIEDQLRICRERVEREGWTVETVYQDKGVSGATLLRPGIQNLLSDAQKGKFDLVVAESIDRISRDQEDIAGIYKRFNFAGVKIVTLSEGEVSELHIGLKGTMGALFLKDLADKTRRGLRGRVEDGKSGGGNCYGFDVVKKFADDGEPIRGERSINERESAIVNRIFEEYASGKSPKAIAVQLNKEKIPSPSGRDWGPSTIYGNRERGTGIINNELYIGRLVWNRLRYIKDPDTGKRVSRLNPEGEWIIKDVPEHRIIAQELWDSVKDRQKPLALAKIKHPCHARRPKFILSGLLKCSECGGGYTMMSKTHVGCATARNKGTCDNRRTMRMDVLENQVLHGLQHHLLDEDLAREFCDEYTRHMNRLRSDELTRRKDYENELAKMPARVRTIMDMIYAAEGKNCSHLSDELSEMKEREIEIKALLEQETDLPPIIHPTMSKIYREKVANLREALNQDDSRQQAADILRTLIDRIVLSPTEAEIGLDIDIEGDLAGILSLAKGQKKTASLAESGGSSSVGENQQLKLVAGVGFEPTTFRL